MPPTGTPLPEDFPGKKVLEANKIKTVEEAQAKTAEELEEFDGIGPKTAADILAWTSSGEGDGARPQAATTQTVAVRPPAPPQAAAKPETVEVKVGTERGPRGTVSTTIDPA